MEIFLIGLSISQWMFMYVAFSLFIFLLAIKEHQTEHRKLHDFDGGDWFALIAMGVFFPIVFMTYAISWIGTALVKPRKMIDIKGIVTGERTGT